MSTADLERELARRRDPARKLPLSGAVKLSPADAIVYRNSGNIPDERGRSLRLVLMVAGEPDTLDARRRLYEPDYLDAPTWRREGSVPVTIVPLREPRVGAAGPWWEQPELKALEDEWRATGKVAGVTVPAEWRGFVYKTVLALRAADRPVTPTSIADAVARWVTPQDATRIRAALEGD